MELRVKNLLIALIEIILSLLLPSFSSAQQWHYALLVEPSSYPLKWKVEDSILMGAIDVIVGETLWNQTYNRVPKEGKISLEGLVLLSYITILRFQVSWSGSGTMFTRFSVFVVLDAPKAPMDPAWVSVLRISCSWARGESTPDGAANMLTQRLWENGKYNGGYIAFTRYVCDGSGNIPPDATEYFYLREFIANRFVGQCNDFADFLVCLITSVGAFQAAAQRTHPLGSGAFHTEVIDLPAQCHLKM